MQVAVEGLPAQCFRIMVFQIHKQESSIVDDIDTAETIVKFNTVEQERFFIEPEHVGEMDIAVTFTNITLLFTPCYQLEKVNKARLTPIL